MSSLETMTAFFGWCTLINTGVLLLSSIMLLMAKDWAQNIHARLFNIAKEELDRIYFNYLAGMKLLIFIFNLTPWIALKLMS